jgi:hypothetical protein
MASARKTSMIYACRIPSNGERYGIIKFVTAFCLQQNKATNLKMPSLSLERLKKTKPSFTVK